jgi:hypothetical protein
VRHDRTVIIGIKPRPWPLIVTFLLGCVSLWMGLTGSLVGSTAGIPSVAVRWFMLAAGVLFVVAVPLLVLSNVIQHWAVLVGSEAGLQVVYPLGLHRFMHRSRLEGKLEGAALKLLRQTPGGRFQGPLTYVRVTAPEGKLEFSFSTTAANVDFPERFAEWAATR